MRKPVIYYFLLIAVWLAIQPATFASPTFEENSKIGQELELPIYEWRDPAVPSKGIIFLLQGLTFYGKALRSFRFVSS